MGADIHGTVERRRYMDGQSKWVAVKILAHGDRAKERNYGRFAALAHVRGEGPSPLGAPVDCADTTRYLIDQWADDGHSHSWLPLASAAEVFLATEFNPAEHIRKYPASMYFDYEADVPSHGDISEYRLVFWFDN